jgi:hypothetical protein
MLGDLDNPMRRAANHHVSSILHKELQPLNGPDRM